MSQAHARLGLVAVFASTFFELVGYFMLLPLLLLKLKGDGVSTAVAGLFAEVARRFAAPRLVVHNIDGRPADVFRKAITEVDPAAVLATLERARRLLALAARAMPPACH